MGAEVVELLEMAAEGLGGDRAKTVDASADDRKGGVCDAGGVVILVTLPLLLLLVCDGDGNGDGSRLFDECGERRDVGVGNERRRGLTAGCETLSASLKLRLRFGVR